MSIVNNFFSKKLWFGILMVLSTLTLSLSAAYYSVFGLSSLFAGAKSEVMIMASALEFSKLILASYLHNHWKRAGWLKWYLTLALVTLMLITSAGIYGFLTSAYQKTADQLGVMDKQVEVVDLKKIRFEESISGYKVEREQLNQSITELTKGLSNNTIQYKDRETGEIITTTSSSTRKVLTEQLNDMKLQRNGVSLKMESLTDSITKLDLQILNLETNNDIAAEVGPLRYMAEITGKSMGVIVNWFTLLIVFVFDPLAIAMVIAINRYIGKSEEYPKRQKNDSFGSSSELSKKDVEVILDTIENPPAPNEPLKKAAENYKRVIKQKSEPPADVESTKEADSKTLYGEDKLKRKYNDSIKGAEGKLK